MFRRVPRSDSQWHALSRRVCEGRNKKEYTRESRGREREREQLVLKKLSRTKGKNRGEREGRG